MHDVKTERLRWRTLDALLRVSVLLGEDMETDLAGRNLSRPRVNVLWVIAREGPMSQKALSDRLGVTPRAVTSLVDGLVETGFVTRQTVETDRRAFRVTMTPLGVSTVSDLQAGAKTLATQLFGRSDAEELEGLTATLDALAQRLETLIAAARE